MKRMLAFSITVSGKYLLNTSHTDLVLDKVSGSEGLGTKGSANVILLVESEAGCKIVCFSFLLFPVLEPKLSLVALIMVVTLAVMLILVQTIQASCSGRILNQESNLGSNHV